MEGGVTKLCDFGLAIDTNAESPVSKVGTVGFQAPELVRLGQLDPETRQAQRRAGKPLYGRAVDVWALGVLVHELLYGHSLFGDDGASDEAVERAVLALGADPELPAVTRAGGAVSAEAAAFVRACLAPDPEGRPTAEALLSGFAFARRRSVDAPAGAPVRDSVSSESGAADPGLVGAAAQAVQAAQAAKAAQAAQAAAKAAQQAAKAAEQPPAAPRERAAAWLPSLGAKLDAAGDGPRLAAEAAPPRDRGAERGGAGAGAAPEEAALSASAATSTSAARSAGGFSPSTSVSTGLFLGRPPAGAAAMQAAAARAKRSAQMSVGALLGGPSSPASSANLGSPSADSRHGSLEGLLGGFQRHNNAPSSPLSAAPSRGSVGRGSDRGVAPDAREDFPGGGMSQGQLGLMGWFFGGSRRSSAATAAARQTSSDASEALQRSVHGGGGMRSSLPSAASSAKVLGQPLSASGRATDPTANRVGSPAPGQAQGAPNIGAAWALVRVGNASPGSEGSKSAHVSGRGSVPAELSSARSIGGESGRRILGGESGRRGSGGGQWRSNAVAPVDEDGQPEPAAGKPARRGLSSRWRGSGGSETDMQRPLGERRQGGRGAPPPPERKKTLLGRLGKFVSRLMSP